MNPGVMILVALQIGEDREHKRFYVDGFCVVAAT